MKQDKNETNGKMILNTRNIAKIGILSATAALAMLLQFPVLFAPSFYQIDVSEIFVLLGAFAMGPVAGVVIEGVKILMNFLLNGTDTAGVGELSNFLIGCSFVVPASMIYVRNKSKKSAILGCIVGIVTMAAVGSILNLYVIIPAYSALYGIPMDAIIAMGTAINPAITGINQLVLFATLPFNLLKGSISAILTILVYKKISPLLHR